MRNSILFYSFFISVMLFAKAESDSIEVDSIKTRQFTQLDQQIALKEMLNSTDLTPYSVTPGLVEVDSIDYDQLQEIFDYCRDQQKFVESITGIEEISLPIGLEGHTNDGFEAEMVIIKAEVTSEYLKFSAFARVQTQHQGLFLYFAAEGLKLSHEGGVIDTWKLHLLGNKSMPMFGGKMLFSVVGSTIEQQTGEFNSNSYIEFDCDGFKSFAFKSDIRIARSLVIPVDENGTQIVNTLGGDLEVVKEAAIGNEAFVGAELDVAASGWNDILIQVSLPTFEVNGLERWNFKLDNAILDMSDSQNSTEVVFPDNYTSDSLFPDGNQDAWRGFYADQVQVILPPEFNNSNNRTQFTANELILDNYGVSGEFSATNVLDKGDASGWKFKVDSLSLKLATNNLIEGKCKGEIKPGSLDSYLSFSGSFTPEIYQMVVKVDSADISMWKGKLVFQQNSSVSMIVDRNINKFKVDAHLNGWMSLTGSPGDTPTNGQNQISSEAMVDFEGIVFQNLHLRSYEAPYIQADYFGYPGSLEVANFPVSFEDIHLVTPTNDQIGIAFDLNINLMDDAGIAAESSLKFIGQMESGEFRSFAFEKIQIDSLSIDIEKSSFELHGKVGFFRDDATYGSGFKGELGIKINKLNVEGSAKGMFAKSDYRYWYADFEINNTNNYNGKLQIQKLHGGLSYRMKRTDGSLVWAYNGASYEPDNTYGLGLRAGGQLQFGSKKSFKAKAFLELQYNNSGGLNRIYFLGEGALMNDTNANQDTTNEELNQILTNYDNAFSDSGEQALLNSYLAQGNLIEIAKTRHPVSTVASQGNIGAYVSVEKDFVNNTFDGLFEIYIKLAGIEGTGPNHKAGWAHLYSSPTKSYIHIGTPIDRLGIKFNVGSYDIEVGGYFMTGDELPSQIPPHPNVVSVLGADILNDNRDLNQLSNATGFAFGLNFALSKSIDLGFFYASLEAGGGFDVMNRHLAGVSCANMTGPLGNNGWYSFGQVYAYLYGQFGIKVKIFGVKKRFSILQAGVAAMLRGEFPNPAHFEGYVGASYNVMGGLVKGRVRFKVEFGEQCDFVGMNEEIGVTVIGDINPDGEVDVDVFKIPQVAFNFAVDNPFTVDTESGTKVVRIKLHEFQLKNQGTPIPGTLEWVDNQTKLNFIAEDILPPETELQGSVIVHFEEKIGSSWVQMSNEGQPAEENRPFSFTTSSAPDYIPLHNIDYAYPVPDTNNFYPQEHQTVYVKLKQGQDYLFDDSWNFKGELYNGEQRISQENLNYNISENKISYAYQNLSTNGNYSLNLMAYAPGVDSSEIDAGDLNQNPDDYTNAVDDSSSADDDTQENTSVVSNNTATAGNMEGVAKSILHFNFATSQHNTFVEKVNSLSNVDNILDIISADVHALYYKTPTYEVFNETELLGSQYTNGVPMIRVESILQNESYYENSIYPLIYQEYPLDGDLEVNRDINLLGFPPIKANDIPEYYQYYITNGLSNSNLVNQRLPYRYNMALAYKQDFLDLQYKIVNRYLSTPINWNQYNQYQYIIEGTFPYLPIGSYDIKIIYAPKGNEFSSEAIRTYTRPY